METIIMDCGDKIKGESTHTGYKDKIELMSYSHGISMSVTAVPSNQNRTEGRPNHSPFSVTKHWDLASCKLIQHLNAGTSIPDIKIYICQNEQDKINPVVTIEMKEVVISSLSYSTSGDGKPVESLSLDYTTIQWTYKPQLAANDQKGNDSTSWSLKTNAAK